MTYSAVISDCGTYRYQLDFKLADEGKKISVIMVNPSKANGVIKDATIRKLDGFGQRLGWASYSVANVFAYRATDINELKNAIDPIGPLNMYYIFNVLMQSDYTVIAWGTLAKLPPQLRWQWREITKMAKAIQRPLYCWGMCADGMPKHPVMIGYDNKLIEWKSW